MLSKFIINFFIWASFSVLGVHSKRVPCNYDNAKCLTESTKLIYPVIVAGRPGEVESSDPLNLNKINIEVFNIKYDLRNATLTGLQNCGVKKVVANAIESHFIYYIWCPSLNIVSDYKVEGALEGTAIKGKGTIKISYSKYHIWLRGYYSKYNDDAGDLHTQISKFTLEVRAEDVAPEYTGLHYGDKAATQENFNQLEKTTREPVMNNFIQKYVKNLNKFLTFVPIKDIHYETGHH